MTKYEELEKEAREKCVCKDEAMQIMYRIGYIDGAGPREKQIAELEQKLEQTEKDLADYQFNYPTIKELQKENADLKEEINKIAFARGNLEEETDGAEKHPLVKDKRFLSLSYFPNVIPDCFKECEK